MGSPSPSSSKISSSQDIIFCFFLFFWALMLSWPESSLSLSELELEDEDESLLESLATPDFAFTSTLSATSASSGSFFLKIRYHFFDSFGLPLTVLCQTTGKLVLLAKFWVTTIVVSMLRTTCHMPPGTKIVSPGCWMHSIGAYLAGQSGLLVLGYMTENQVIASSLCFPPSALFTVIKSF